MWPWFFQEIVDQPLQLTLYTLNKDSN